MQTLKQAVEAYELSEYPAALPSLMGEAEVILHQLKDYGLDYLANPLRSLFEEMDHREQVARKNAQEDRKRSRSLADRVAFMEEVIDRLQHRLESAILDKDEMAFEMHNLTEKMADEIAGALEDGQNMALVGICNRLGAVLEVDPDALHMLFVRALDGNMEEAAEVLDLLENLQETME